MTTKPQSKNRAWASREQRKSAGKALRDKCPRNAHATWKPPRNRSDPINLLIQSSKGRIPRLLPIRYGRMMESPFAFYRGAAAIMASDLAHTPVTGIRNQICGDCHLMNFGAFGTPERRIIFDINDFDETLPGPWEWDVKRLVASFVIAGRHNGQKNAENREAARRCAQSYRERMQEYAELGALQVWYQRIDDIVAMIQRKELEKTVAKQIAKATSRNVAEDDFPKLATARNGRFRIKDNPPLIFHDTELAAKEYDRMIHAAFRRYRETLSDDLKVLLNHYDLKDVAIKVVRARIVSPRLCLQVLVGGKDYTLNLKG